MTPSVDPGPLLRQLQLTLPAAPGGFGDHGRRSHSIWVAHPVPTSRQMAEACGVGRASIERWKAGRPIAVRLAEQVAVRLGFHPLELWPDLYEVAS